MSEWKGLWKCEDCGKSGSDYWRDIINKRGHHVLNENENCYGKIIPYDRRNIESMSKKLPLDTESGDVKLQPMYKIGCRAGIEKMRDAVAAMWNTMRSLDELDEAAEKLLAEQEEK